MYCDGAAQNGHPVHECAVDGCADRCGLGCAEALVLELWKRTSDKDKMGGYLPGRDLAEEGWLSVARFVHRHTQRTDARQAATGMLAAASIVGAAPPRTDMCTLCSVERIGEMVFDALDPARCSGVDASRDGPSACLAVQRGHDARMELARGAFVDPDQSAYAPISST